MRRGYMMVELTLVLIISSIITYFALVDKDRENFDSEFNLMISDVVKIFEVGVVDEYTGYISGRNSYCSSTGYYEDITAYRIDKCAEFKWIDSVFTGGGVADEKDPEKSYFQWLTTRGAVGDGCIGRLGLGDNNATEIKLLMDCSDIVSDYSNGIENLLISGVMNGLGPIFKSYDINATSMSAGGGDDLDGIVLFTLEK